jgi:adenylate kinase family enzyme
MSAVEPKAATGGRSPTCVNDPKRTSRAIAVSHGNVDDEQPKCYPAMRQDHHLQVELSEPLTERTVVIGNSGSGKSTLAEAIANLADIPAIDLDLLHWEEDGFGSKRNEAVARKMVLDISDQPRWIIEGAFGWLAEVALPKATALIWLDFPWSLCRAGLLARGLRRGATNRDAAELMKWAEAYWTRQTPSSFTGHSRLFNDLSGTKLRLQSREQVAQLIDNLRAKRPISI